MPAATRVGDKSQCPADAHGCPGCAHGVIGPAVSGSPDVFINGKPALRVGDPGIHAACCGPNTWKAIQGSPNVFINGKPAHRLGDADQHCGGIGRMIEGSRNVFINEVEGGEGMEKNGDKAEEKPKSDSQVIKEAMEAKESAIKLLDERINQLENEWDKEEIRKDFVDRFHTDDPDVRDDVLLKLKRIREAMKNLDAKNLYVMPKHEAKPKTWADVDPKDRSHQVKLHTKFINAPIMGRDSKAGTLIHEISHFNDVTRTSDYAYQESADLLLDPARSTYNADTIERYCEDAFQTMVRR